MILFFCLDYSKIMHCVNLHEMFYMRRTWPKEEVITFCERSDDILDTYKKNPEFSEAYPGATG